MVYSEGMSVVLVMCCSQDLCHLRVLSAKHAYTQAWLKSMNTKGAMYDASCKLAIDDDVSYDHDLEVRVAKAQVATAQD